MVSKKILFICTGNTCRSPIAESYSTKKIKQKHNLFLKDISFNSAGLIAEKNLPASANSIIISEKYDISLREHKSKCINKKMIEESYLVLGMTELHIKELKTRYQDSANKIFKISNWFNNQDIVDPFGGNIDVYEECYYSIAEAVDCLMKFLRNN